MREEHLIKTNEFGILDRVGRLFVGTPEERQALIEREGEAFQRRYQACEDSFLNLLDTIGTVSVDGERRSPEIVIGKAVERVDVLDYRGTWVAGVTELNAQERQKSVRMRPIFQITARFVPDDRTVLCRVPSSEVPHISERFGAHYAFSQASEMGWTKEMLTNAVNNYSNSVDRAEETLAMLWTAVRDPRRNYQLAVKAIGVSKHKLTAL